jgi:ABC-type multidrug transport system ATPase subunit
MVAAGIALVPEGRRLFGQMTVMDNLRMGAYARHARAAAEHRLAWVLALFPRLAERRGQLASTMSGGEQQMLAIARALMSKPKLLLLDEPSLGLAPALVKDLFAILHRIRAHGLSVVLVEQSVRQSLRLADFVYVLENGRIVRSGRSAEIEGDAAIQVAYLGRAARPSLPATEARPAAGQAASGPVGAVRAADGLGHSRSVAAAAGADAGRHEKEQSMDRRTMDSVGAGAGFFHPFARSVGGPPQPPVRSAAAEPAAVETPAPRLQDIPTTGGFINPHAINPQARPSRL